MMFHWPEQVRFESILEQAKPFCRFAELAQSLPKLHGCISPERLQIDVGVRQITGRHAQKRKSPTSPKMDSYY